MPLVLTALPRKCGLDSREKQKSVLKLSAWANRQLGMLLETVGAAFKLDQRC